ncbi:MAG: glycosyltransferase family 4 protein [Planctomycetota bacterium]
MKIACVIHSLDGGGAERVMAELASRLALAKHDVTLVTLDDGATSKHTLDDSVATVRLDVMGESQGLVERIQNTRRRIQRLRSALAELQPQVILSFCDRTNILTLMAAKPLAIPVVVSERSDPQQQKLGLFWERLRVQTYRRAAAVVALTSTSAQHLSRRLKRDVDVIPSAVDHPPFRSDRQVAASNRRIVAIGRLEFEKGFDRLIEAFHPLAQAYPDWSLRILGEGLRRYQLESQIADGGLSDRISMPGWVRPIWDELGAATVFVLPSRYEGFPSALLEAMAMGVPSVAVDCESGPRAIIDVPSQGLLVEDNVAALHQGMQRLIEEESLRESLGQNGQDVVERFSWERMTEQYERLLSDLATAALK